MISFHLIKYTLLSILVIQTSPEWLPEVTGYDKNDENNGFAGIYGKPIIGLRVDGGKEYRVHIKDGDWLDAVTGNDINDCRNGFAGNGKIIDAFAISGVNKYSAHRQGEGWFKASKYDINDNIFGYAGSYGYVFDAIMIEGRKYAVYISDSDNFGNDNEDYIRCQNDLYFTSIIDNSYTSPENTFDNHLVYSYYEELTTNCEKGEPLNKSILKNFDISTTSYEFKSQILKNITEYINSSKIINGSDFLAVISYSDDMNQKEQIENGKSAIDLGNCTQTIKNHYNMSEDEKLIIVNMEEKYNKSRENKYDSNFSLDLGKNIQIEVYDTSGKQLDLSVCKDEIKLMKYIGDVEELDFLSAESLSKQGIDVFNRNDKFFNDICHPNRIENKDTILKDRVSDIYQNVIICQEGCAYKDINYDLMIANCICNSNSLQIRIDNKTNNDNKNIIKEKIDLNWIKKLLKTSLEQITVFHK